MPVAAQYMLASSGAPDAHQMRTSEAGKSRIRQQKHKLQLFGGPRLCPGHGDGSVRGALHPCRSSK
eukprot:1158503-Pelagomonas_calceolata.AAC.2